MTSLWKGGNGRSRAPGIAVILLSAALGALAAATLMSQGGRTHPHATSDPTDEGSLSVGTRGPLDVDLAGIHMGGDKFFGSWYMTMRENLTYYQTVLRLAQQYAPEAKTMIDVGAPWPYVTAFKWIPTKVMLNDHYENVGIAELPKGLSMVEADFMDYQPEEQFDLVICNQVLEHVDDPGAFARKLLATGKVVIASVPHQWSAVNAQGHKHHHIDQNKLISWFRRYDYREIGVVKEVDRVCGDKCRRLYVVYTPVVPPEEKYCDVVCQRKRAAQGPPLDDTTVQPLDVEEEGSEDADEEDARGVSAEDR